MARRLTDGSKKAVTKIIGIRNPRSIKIVCNSIPLIIGICTSEIKHAVSATRCDWRNSCADAKVYTSKPSDFTRFSVAARNRGKFPGGGQGNCISKEREEFDEIILIPGGFFEFSA